MKTHHFFLVTLCALVTSLQAQYNWQEASSGGYTYRYISGDPSHARYYQLNNGLTVLLAPDAHEPRIQTYIATKAGSADDPASNTGLAHYLEHMLFKGTDQFGTLDWAKEKPLLDQIENLYSQYNQTTDAGIRAKIYHEIDSVSGEAAKYSIANEYDKMLSAIGALGTNAFTWYDLTAYTNDIPSNQVENWLNIEAERFRMPVFRLFHTELEAVYEEKNISLDSESDMVFDSIFANLFPNHPYGTQTTIGTIEHLKNPSLQAIRDFYNTFYVAPHMCIVLAGDFNPDEVIRLIDKKFNFLPATAPSIPERPSVAPLAAPKKITVVGQESPYLEMGFAFPAANTPDGEMMLLIAELLSNGTAGLMDINLIQGQKVLDAYAYSVPLREHSVLFIGGEPKGGQSLDDLKNLLLEQIQLLKDGNIDPLLLEGVTNNLIVEKMETNEENDGIAYSLLDAFISDLDPIQQLTQVERLRKITVAEIQEFAQKWLNNNYVAVYKTQGKPLAIPKVEKPPITPVDVNREAQSNFLAQIINAEVKPIEPQYANFEKDIKFEKLGNIDVLSTYNSRSDLFLIYFKVNFGTNHDLRMKQAADYLNYLGTEDLTPEQVQMKFYQMGTHFGAYATGDYTYITLSGLNANFNESVALMEQVMAHAKPDAKVLKENIANTLQERKVNKLNAWMIQSALSSYCRFGAENPMNYVLDNKSLKKLTATELTDLIHNLFKYPQTILYDGGFQKNELIAAIEAVHPPDAYSWAEPAKKQFNPLTPEKTEIVIANYDKVQLDIGWTRPVADFNPELFPITNLFNQYFGGGMSSIVFQEIRESRALAYSTYSVMTMPYRTHYPFQMLAYVGCQADKMKDAIGAMQNLLDTLPVAQHNFDGAVSSIRNDISTNRLYGMTLLQTYELRKEQGLKTDINQANYEYAQKASLEDVLAFQKQYVAGKPFRMYVLGLKKSMNIKYLQSLGTVKEVKLTELFGY